MSDTNLIHLDELRRKAKLAGSGGGSDDGGMLDQRVAALESDMREVKATLGRIEALIRGLDDRLRGLDDRVRRVEIEMAEVKGRISQLPTAWMMLTGGVGLMLAIFGGSLALLRFGLPR